MRRVFISYSTKNTKIVKRICAALERAGWKCWIAPRDISPGSDWAESIVAAIEGSRLMIAVVSKDACDSEHVARELDRAAANRVPILPARLDATPLSGQFAYFLGNKQSLDLAGRSWNDFESDVVNAVRTLLTPSGGRAEVGDNPQPASPGQPSPAFHPTAGQSPGGIYTFIAGAMKREKALADVDLSEPRTLGLAFTILISVSLATAILHIPAWNEQGIHYGNPAFIPLATAFDLIEPIAFCLLLHLAIRMFGAAADALQFFNAFCLLGAYWLMSNIVQAPVWVRAIAFHRGVPLDSLPIGDLAVIAAGSAAAFAFKIVLARSLFKAFHITEQLGAIRAALSFLTGIAMWILTAWVISKPLEDSLYKLGGS
jgi:hypothetical protein